MLAGCTSSTAPAPMLPTHTVTSRPNELVDPLAEITDPTDGRFVAAKITPLLHKGAEGPGTFTISGLADVQSVRIYIACAPDSHFRVTVGKWFSGGCSSRFQNWADIPVENVRAVNVAVPAGTRYALLVIRTP